MENAGIWYLNTHKLLKNFFTSAVVDFLCFLRQKPTRERGPTTIVFIIYILRHSSFWPHFHFKSFQNAKICHYTLQNDNKNEVSAF